MVLLSKVLEVSVEELLCGDADKIRQKSGPRGKLLRIFHEVSELPRHHQKDVIEVLDMYVRAKQKKIAQPDVKTAVAQV
jgi:hypothetical protein